MKILITGAHFTPAQAVIEELLKQPGVEVIYIGRNTTLEGDKTLSIESQILPKLGVKFYPIIAGRLRRNLIDIHTFISLLKIPVGFFQSFFILLKEQPNVILSLGGYVAVPTVVWAWFLSIPVIVHEQTLVSGLANQISNFFATKIAVSFDTNYSFKREKIILTGNPIRKELVSSTNHISPDLADFLKEHRKQSLPLIYITGGNQGSHIINEAVLKILGDLVKIAFVIHQTGDSKYKDFEKLEEQKNNLKYQERYLVQKWFDVEDVSNIFRHAELVISRAGANTLYELSYFAIPTLVIPLPYLYKDEQNKNAKFFENLGLCQILPQGELTSKSLLENIHHLIKEQKSLKTNAKNAQKIVVKDAAKKLAQQTLVLASEYV